MALNNSSCDNGTSLWNFEPICGEYMKRKKTKSSHKKVRKIRATRPLDLLHMDLMGPMHTKTRSGKRYFLLVVDDFLRYSSISFHREKSKTIEHLKYLFNRI